MEKQIKKFFPNAETGHAVTESCMNTLTGEHKFDKGKTILATSVCSDEVNRSTTNFQDYLGVENPFSMGGLGGYPFTGLTGLGAFCGHIPDNGFAIIVYGPHIGFTKHGEPGYVNRIGQSHNSTCCGALKASVSAIEAGTAGQRDKDLDYQQWKLEEALKENSDVISKGQDPIVKATEVMYQTIDRQIKRLMDAGSNQIKNCTVALVGGIMINTDHELPDWFDLRELSVQKF